MPGGSQAHFLTVKTSMAGTLGVKTALRVFPPGHDACDQLHPVVLPQVLHFMQVPFRTRVKLPHSPQASPS